MKGSSSEELGDRYLCGRRVLALCASKVKLPLSVSLELSLYSSRLYILGIIPSMLSLFKRKHVAINDLSCDNSKILSRSMALFATRKRYILMNKTPAERGAKRDPSPGQRRPRQGLLFYTRGRSENGCFDFGPRRGVRVRQRTTSLCRHTPNRGED